jgi:hypothetical protein
VAVALAAAHRLEQEARSAHVGERVAYPDAELQQEAPRLADAAREHPAAGLQDLQRPEAAAAGGGTSSSSSGQDFSPGDALLRAAAAARAAREAEGRAEADPADGQASEGLDVAQVSMSEDAPEGSGTQAAGGAGHELLSINGFRICTRCKAYAKELNGKHRSLGKSCVAASGNALRLRNLKIANIRAGLDPKTGRRLSE